MFGFGSGCGSNRSLTGDSNESQQKQAEENNNRLLVLLMDPPSKQYELNRLYSHITPRCRGRRANQLRELIPLIPKAASHEPLRAQSYLGFTRPTTGVEMLNTLTVADYSIKKDEVLLAIPRGKVPRNVSSLPSPYWKIQGSFGC